MAGGLTSLTQQSTSLDHSSTLPVAVSATATTLPGLKWLSPPHSRLG